MIASDLLPLRTFTVAVPDSAFRIFCTYSPDAGIYGKPYLCCGGVVDAIKNDLATAALGGSEQAKRALDAAYGEAG